MVVTAGAEEPQVIGAFMLLPESGSGDERVIWQPGRLTLNQPVSQSPGGFGWSAVRNVTETQAGHSGG